MSVSVRTGARTRARLAALGAYAPERVITNAEIEGWVETSDEWIRTRTGIRERHWAAAGLGEGGIARSVLVVGAEIMSRITDPTDRGTCILFADGSGADDLVAPIDGFMRMNGPEVFRFATRVMVDSTERLLEATGMGIEEIDLVVAHQANSRILDHACERLGIPSDRVFSNIDRYEPAEAA